VFFVFIGCKNDAALAQAPQYGQNENPREMKLDWRSGTKNAG